MCSEFLNLAKLDFGCADQLFTLRLLEDAGLMLLLKSLEQDPLLLHHELDVVNLLLLMDRVGFELKQLRSQSVDLPLPICKAVIHLTKLGFTTLEGL